MANSENMLGGQFLSFELGGDSYGLEILRVQEIRGWESVRALPEAPGYVKGVLDLRGTIVPIIDLRIRFGEQNPEYIATTVVIVTSVSAGEDGNQLIGIVVDAVSDVLDVSEEDMKPAPNIGSTISKRYLHGMISLDRGMVVFIDVDKLLSPQELEQLEDLAA